MKRTVVAATVIGLALSGAGLASAKPGNGAQKSGLAAKTSYFTCSSAAAAEAGKQTANGFAVLNAPGKPGSPHKIVGEVALKNAPAGSYDVRLASTPNSCGTSVGSLTVGANGNGNASIAAPGAAGTYYVVLTQPVVVAELPGTVQRFASAPVTLR